jgi:cytochrome c-type biogenesis protein CcmF
LKFEDIQPGVQDGEGVVTTAVLGAFENGKRVATLKPKSIFFERQNQNETLPAIWQDAPFFRRDLYVIVQGWDDNFATVSFRAYVNPLIAWVWWGGGLYLLFTLVTMWPDPVEARSRVREFVGVGMPAE